MAKRKHATALFEVIHSKKNSQKSLLSTPRWWFKKSDQAKADAAAAAIASAPHVAHVAHVARERESASEDTSNDPTAGRDAVDHQIVSPVPAPASAHRAVAHADDAAPSRTSAGVDLAVDPDRQQITFKVSYTSAIIVTFSVLVAVGLAYLVGQKMSRGPSLAMGGQTSEQLRAGPKNPGVMDVGQRNAAANSTSQQREPEMGITSRGPENNPDNVEPPAGTNANANNPNAPTQSGPRVLNLNYVVVQSYPDQKSAEEARDALVKAGIACTIEHDLKLRGLNESWYTVIGTQGFQRASGKDYEAYVAKIVDVSEKFAQRKRSFKAFQPLAYKWTHAG